MARGRFISNAIMGDKKVNELSDDTSRLAFTWLITTADVEGRTHGDPAMVRSLLFPRRDDISTEQMESYINEWHQARIVNWYKCNDDLWIEFPNFDKHQVNLRKDREPESNIPPLSEGTLQPYTPNLSGNIPADIRNTSGKMTGEDKLREEKRSKEKIREGGAEKAPRRTPTPIPPGVTAYREAAHRYPNKSLYSLIDNHVGCDADRVDFWRKVVIEYIALGWNPSNISGQLEWFDRNEIPTKNGAGAKHGSGPVSMMDVIKEAQKDPNYGKR